ncbi:YALI0E33627p [Yarrowia lipolytica CLIB122]|nr:YALI0E33627p [Yarrowia lipolytica CLIB122]CAG80343.1 YALI0E33627p [Yarrowia lipolytica CLIB122]|eukprot:XP_504739.1 YALI0E33627p [Yarrowia lipolytica CLIB122]
MKSATGLLVILLIAFALQLVAVLSVPVTKTISLGSYQDHKFGVFGYCNVKDGTCSPAGVGYNLVDSDNAGFSLPSNARHTLSNLLIVHPIATGFTLILTVLAMLAHIQGPASSSRYLLFCLVFSLPTFLLVLLSFLVDILLFVPHLDWGGWIVLAATILVAISGVVLCVMRRTLSSKKAMKKHQLDTTNELSAFSSHKHLNSFTYSSKENVPQFSELRYETSHDTSKDEEVLPLTSHVYEEPGHHVGDTSYASQGTNNSRVNLLTSEEPQAPKRESPFKDQRQDRYTPDRYGPSPDRYDQGGPGRPPNGSRGVPPRRPSNGPTPPGQGPSPTGAYGRNNNPNYNGGYNNRLPRPRGPPGSNNSSPFLGARNGPGLTPPHNLQTATTGPMQLPAGTYLPGEEPANSPDTYGPGVIPIPEIRRESKVPGASPTPPPVSGNSPPTETSESGVSRPYRGNYSRRGSEASAQTPPNAQPNPPPGGAQNYEYVPARQQWNLTTEESNATAPAPGPQPLQRNHSYDTYNPYRSETPSAPGSRAQSQGTDDNLGTLHQPVPTTVTPSNSGALNNKDSPWYSPPVDEQFRNSFIPDAPVSPSESISSNFTSVSQRGINPRYFGADGPPGGLHQGAPPPPHMRGPPPHMGMGGPNMGGHNMGGHNMGGPPPNMGPRPPYGGGGPGHGNKHDLLLSGNPDSQFQPQTRRKPGRGGRPGMSPASLMGRDTGPYSMR